MNSTAFKKIASGSSKDIYTHSEFKDHVFVEFSDRISVFDYGPLPEELRGRGEYMKRFALHIEKMFLANGLLTAFDWMLHSQTQFFVMKRAAGSKVFASEPSVQKSDLKFIPLEVIFRWGAPLGSGILSRRPEFQPLEKFKVPLIEFSTKLESKDRILSEQEAECLAGSAECLRKIEAFAIKAAELLKIEFKKCGLDLWDGKIEVAISEKSGEIFLVDAVTPDELRLSYPGLEKIPLSKELLRQWLGSTLWAREVGLAKRDYGDSWRTHVSLPPRLGNWREECLLNIYRALVEGLEKSSSKPIVDLLRMEGGVNRAPKVYVLGGGGREAAMKWRLRLEGAEIATSAVDADSVLVTQDADIKNGLADEWRSKRYFVSGASSFSSRIEWSKEFGREVAQMANIPVPQFKSSRDAVRTFSQPPVIKFDGLAKGKGVVVSKTYEEAEAAFDQFSKMGKVLVEERLTGFEASVFFYVRQSASGGRVQFLGCAQDFKRRYPGDVGPNTGGMGALTPHSKINFTDVQTFTKFAEDTVNVLDGYNTPYEGWLYLGVLKDQKGVWYLVEYNARPGDPETQALMMSWPPDRKILRSLLQLSLAGKVEVTGEFETALCLALVRPEYPNEASSDMKLPKWDFSSNSKSDVQLFRNNSVGGRVAYLVARGNNHREAADRIFEMLVQSPWKDILEWRADLLP